MKKFVALLMVMSLALCVAFAAGAQEEAPAKDGVKAGVIICNRGDNSVNDMLYNAVENASKVYGFTFDTAECTVADISMALQDFVEDGSYDVLITLYHTLEQAKALEASHPDQKYMFYDVEVRDDAHIVSQAYAKNQLGFIAGVYAALVEQSGSVTINGKTTTWTPGHKYGAILGVELPSTIGAITGFEAGVKYIDPQAEFNIGTIGDWANQATAKELALAMYDSGVHVLFHNAGGAFMGAVEAAKTKGLFAIGYDANQNNFSKDNILASSHKNHDQVLLNFFGDFMNQKFDGGNCVVNGYNNGGASFTFQDGNEVPAEIKAIVEETIKAIENGTINPPNSWDALAQWNLSYNK